MSLFRYPALGNFSRLRLKWVIWVFLLAFSPLSALGASPEPLMVVNPFVPIESLHNVRGIEETGEPLLVLNPYVEPLESAKNSPYQWVVPTPQIIFPAGQK